MRIDNSFAVQAPADRVYEFLLDVNRVVGCVPGAQLSEVVDPDTFRGRVRIKVGPVTVSYQGTARITARDAAARSAKLEAEGRETTGSGSARATATMTVAEEGSGSTVTFATELAVVGRVAQFGRGIMEDVSRHLVGQMGECIRAKLEGGDGAAEPAGAGAPAATAGMTPAASSSAGGSAAPASMGPPGAGSTGSARGDGSDGGPPASAPLDALALARGVGRERLRRLRRRETAMVLAGLAALGGLLLAWRVRRRPASR
jgi:carbon monoxide dehydrogenase subunit G